MSNKKLLGFIASLSLIGGLNGTGQVFAAKKMYKEPKVERGENYGKMYKEPKVEREGNYGKMVEDCVDNLAERFGKSEIVLPVLEIDNEGNITVRKSKWRWFGVGAVSKKIGKNFELNEKT